MKLYEIHYDGSPNPAYAVMVDEDQSWEFNYRNPDKGWYTRVHAVDTKIRNDREVRFIGETDD